MPQLTNAAVASGHNVIAMKRDSGSPVKRLIPTNIAIRKQMYSSVHSFHRRLNARVQTRLKNKSVTPSRIQ